LKVFKNFFCLDLLLVFWPRSESDSSAWTRFEVTFMMETDPDKVWSLVMGQAGNAELGWLDTLRRLWPEAQKLLLR
jgi:hypothetical protein